MSLEQQNRPKQKNTSDFWLHALKRFQEFSTDLGETIIEPGAAFNKLKERFVTNANKLKETVSSAIENDVNESFVDAQTAFNKATDAVNSNKLKSITLSSIMAMGMASSLAPAAQAALDSLQKVPQAKTEIVITPQQTASREAGVSQKTGETKQSFKAGQAITIKFKDQKPFTAVLRETHDSLEDLIEHIAAVREVPIENIISVEPQAVSKETIVQAQKTASDFTELTTTPLINIPKNSSQVEVEPNQSTLLDDPQDLFRRQTNSQLTQEAAYGKAFHALSPQEQARLVEQLEMVSDQTAVALFDIANGKPVPESDLNTKILPGLTKGQAIEYFKANPNERDAIKNANVTTGATLVEFVKQNSVGVNPLGLLGILAGFPTIGFDTKESLSIKTHVVSQIETQGTNPSLQGVDSLLKGRFLTPNNPNITSSFSSNGSKSQLVLGNLVKVSTDQGLKIDADFGQNRLVTITVTSPQAIKELNDLGSLSVGLGNLTDQKVGTIEINGIKYNLSGSELNNAFKNDDGLPSLVFKKDTTFTGSQISTPNEVNASVKNKVDSFLNNPLIKQEEIALALTSNNLSLPVKQELTKQILAFAKKYLVDFQTQMSLAPSDLAKKGFIKNHRDALNLDSGSIDTSKIQGARVDGISQFKDALFKTNSEALKDVSKRYYTALSPYTLNLISSAKTLEDQEKALRSAIYNLGTGRSGVTNTEAQDSLRTALQKIQSSKNYSPTGVKTSKSSGPYIGFDSIGVRNKQTVSYVAPDSEQANERINDELKLAKVTKTVVDKFRLYGIDVYGLLGIKDAPLDSKTSLKVAQFIATIVQPPFFFATSERQESSTQIVGGVVVSNPAIGTRINQMTQMGRMLDALNTPQYQGVKQISQLRAKSNIPQVTSTVTINGQTFNMSDLTGLEKEINNAKIKLSGDVNNSVRSGVYDRTAMVRNLSSKVTGLENAKPGTPEYALLEQLSGLGEDYVERIANSYKKFGPKRGLESFTKRVRVNTLELAKFGYPVSNATTGKGNTTEFQGYDYGKTTKFTTNSGSTVWVLEADLKALREGERPPTVRAAAVECENLEQFIQITGPEVSSKTEVKVDGQPGNVVKSGAGALTEITKDASIVFGVKVPKAKPDTPENEQEKPPEKTPPKEEQPPETPKEVDTAGSSTSSPNQPATQPPNTKIPNPDGTKPVTPGDSTSVGNPATQPPVSNTNVPNPDGTQPITSGNNSSISNPATQSPAGNSQIPNGPATTSLGSGVTPNIPATQAPTSPSSIPIKVNLAPSANTPMPDTTVAPTIGGGGSTVNPATIEFGGSTPQTIVTPTVPTPK